MTFKTNNESCLWIPLLTTNLEQFPQERNTDALEGQCRTQLFSPLETLRTAMNDAEVTLLTFYIQVT